MGIYDGQAGTRETASAARGSLESRVAEMLSEWEGSDELADDFAKRLVRYVEAERLGHLGKGSESEGPRP